MIAATWRTAVFVCCAAAATVGFAFLHTLSTPLPYRSMSASVSMDWAWVRAHVDPSGDAAEYGLRSPYTLVFRKGGRLSAWAAIRSNRPGGTVCLIIAAATTGRSAATECKPLNRGWRTFPRLYLTAGTVGVAYYAAIVVHGNPHGFEAQGTNAAIPLLSRG